MKIVYLTPAAQRGGAEAVLIEVIKGVRRTRPEWQLHLIAGEEGPLLPGAELLGAVCEVVPFPAVLRVLGEGGDADKLLTRLSRLPRLVVGFFGALAYAARLRSRVKVLKPDIVHSNGMKMHLLSAIALRRQSTPKLIWHFHDYLGARPLMSKLLKRFASRCDLVLAISDSVASDAREALPGVQVERLYNCVDIKVFTPVGKVLNLDRLAGFDSAPEATVRVGLVATFARWKGHEVFLRAISGLKSDFSLPTSGLRFYVIGGPIYATRGSQWTFEELRRIARDLGVAHRVGFTGFVEDVPSAIRSLDIVVHASTKPEPFGLVIVQAMACERAVISSGIGGANELLASETDALVFDINDPANLATAIDRLVNDHDLHSRLGRAGRQKVIENFPSTRMRFRLVELYEKLQDA